MNVLAERMEVLNPEQSKNYKFPECEQAEQMDVLAERMKVLNPEQNGNICSQNVSQLNRLI